VESIMFWNVVFCSLASLLSFRVNVLLPSSTLNDPEGGSNTLIVNDIMVSPLTRHYSYHVLIDWVYFTPSSSLLYLQMDGQRTKDSKHDAALCSLHNY
jgi:hypothetical protein